ncbi:MAG: cell division protein ZapB [Candidatus Cloacimonadota bacterium]|jgi:chromosome segregation ATPase|nr:cell division protein ZapB [Candidatus Cloacimonadota bacterium]
MESPIVNLQERLQKLIDQYAKNKKELDELQQKYAQLTDENVQLLSQIEDYSKLASDTETALKELQTKYNNLKAKYDEIEKMLFGVESFADDAIKKIDDIFPKIGESE